MLGAKRVAGNSLCTSLLPEAVDVEHR